MKWMSFIGSPTYARLPRSLTLCAISTISNAIKIDDIDAFFSYPDRRSASSTAFENCLKHETNNERDTNAEVIASVFGKSPNFANPLVVTNAIPQHNHDTADQRLAYPVGTPLDASQPEIVDLELYLAWRSRG